MFCPKGCTDPRYGGGNKQWMSLHKDEHGLPDVYKCPRCGFTHQLTRKEKILEIIYGAEWDFGGEEVPEYYIEDKDVDRVISQIVQVVEMTRRR